MVANPKDIFKFMQKNQIGCLVALFYVAWAWVTENTGNFPQADKIYERGLRM